MMGAPTGTPDFWKSTTMDSGQTISDVTPSPRNKGKGFRA